MHRADCVVADWLLFSVPMSLEKTPSPNPLDETDEFVRLEVFFCDFSTTSRTTRVSVAFY